MRMTSIHVETVGCRDVQTERRLQELMALGVKVNLVCIGRKGTQYFGRRKQYNMTSKFNRINHNGCTVLACMHPRVHGTTRGQD